MAKLLPFLLALAIAIGAIFAILNLNHRIAALKDKVKVLEDKVCYAKDVCPTFRTIMNSPPDQTGYLYALPPSCWATQ
jgi:hypothetical protein